MDGTGYRNLTELISRGWVEGQRQGRALLDRSWVMAQSEGLIALSGGREGDIGRHLLSDHHARHAPCSMSGTRPFPVAITWS